MADTNNISITTIEMYPRCACGCGKFVTKHRNKYLHSHNLNKELCAKAGAAGKGKKLTKEHKNKISLSHMGEKNYMFGKKLSIEHRKKISEKNKGRKHSLESIKKWTKLFNRMIKINIKVA